MTQVGEVSISSDSLSEDRRGRAYTCYSLIMRNSNESEVNIIKQISKQGMNLLIKRGIIRNTNHGYVYQNGNDIGYYRTKGVARKRYVKDKFVNMLSRL